MALRTVKAGEVLSAGQWNELLAAAGLGGVGPGIEATATPGGGVSLSLSERADRVLVWGLVTAVHGADGDAAETITYDAVAIGEPLATLGAATPAYGRVYASGVATAPASVGDLCIIVRQRDGVGAVVPKLWILSERYHGRRCSADPPPPPPPPPGKPPEGGPLVEPAPSPLPLTAGATPTGMLARAVGAVRDLFAPPSAPPSSPGPTPPSAPAFTPPNGPTPPKELSVPPRSYNPAARPIAATYVVNVAVAGSRVRVPVPPGVGVRVTASAAGGTWTSPNKLRVRLDGPGGSVDFATAKEIAGPGGSVTCTAEELRGVEAVVVEQGGTPDAAGTFATVSFVAAYDAAVSISSALPSTPMSTPAPSSESVTPEP